MRRGLRALFPAICALLAALVAAGCGGMQGPERIVLGEPRGFRPITLDAADAGLAGRDALLESARAMREREQGADPRDGSRREIRTGMELPSFAADPAERGRLRGTCLVVPGILGEASSAHVVDALVDDGWCVAIVWPPLVPRIRAEMRASRDADAAERGGQAARAVDALLGRTSRVAQLLLVEMHASVEGLDGKPVVLVCESMGAIVGVGLAASEAVPFDAAVFVAGGGGFIDVARGSTLRGVLFGELPLEDPRFTEAFSSGCGFDPLRCARSLRGAPVAVITAERDAIVPIATQEALWSELGEPPRFRWNAGHLELFVRGRETIAPLVRRIADAVGDRAQAADALRRARGPDLR